MTAEEQILKYTASTKWEEIEKIQWTTSEMMEVMDLFTKEKDSQIKELESKAKHAYNNGWDNARKDSRHRSWTL